MKCSECGSSNFEIAEFCSMCGKPLSSAAGMAAPVGTVATGAYVAGESKTSGLAIGAFVMAILSPVTCFLAAIPAMIMGIVALVKIKDSGGTQKGQGYAIAAIALPVVLLPMVALMMGMLMPALAHTRQLAFRMVCGTQMSGLGKAMMIYANDYDDEYPDPNQWCDLLIEYVEVTPKSLQCLGASEGVGHYDMQTSHYAMNSNVAKQGTASPTDMVLLFETHEGWNMSGGAEMITADYHQGDGCNVVFVDSHVEFVRTENFGDLRWE